MDKKVVILIIFMLMGPLVVVGCTTSATTENKTAIVTKNVTAAMENKIGVAANQKYTIRLRSNSSTGHRWQENYDSTCISLVNKTFRSDPNPSGAVGVGGYGVCTFKALKMGTIQLNLTASPPAHMSTVPRIPSSSHKSRTL